MKLNTPTLPRAKTNGARPLNGRHDTNARGGGAAQRDLELMELRGQLAAINKAQAVIEFDLTGTVLHANDNFLSALGYTLEEVKGRHHSMFVEPA